VKWREAPAVADVDWIAAIEHSRLFESLGSKLTVEIVDDATDER
jgi:hypothetical protein